MSNGTNGHFGAMTSTNVGYLPPAGPLRWRAQFRIMVVTRGPRMTCRRPGPTCRLRSDGEHFGALAPPSSPSCPGTPAPFQLGTITMDSPAPPPNPTAAKPGMDGFCQGFRVIPGPVVMEPVTGALMAALSMTGSGTVTWPH